ncbi:MAG: hypothetical protein KDE31_14795, partial [Caldilineaceae bacterium]|nr:hypothetical protein [Caldilineaceae bacterium]
TAISVGRTMPDAVLLSFDPTLAPEIPDHLCPYVGLAAFRESQQPFFFGRQQLVDGLMAEIAEDRLLAVVGSSGSGKSSLVLAGLLPALKHGAVPAQGDIPASDQWRYSDRMVPGSDPLANLGRAILPQKATDAQDTALAAKFAFVADGCRQEPDYLVKLINETGETPFVLVVDQFEEIFTLCTDETLRSAFINNLLALIESPGPRHRLILTMRTDFESFVARLPEFQPHFEEAIIRVTPLNAAELRAVIEQPAAMVGLKFEEKLVDALVQDVLGEPAALPLLQFTLLKLWERRDRNRITWDTYKALGGGRLALQRSADELYANLIPEDQVTARRILLRLVRPGDGLEITSNRVRRSVFYQSGEARDRVDRVLDRLIEADLLRLSSGDRVTDDQIEIAHEALVRNWPRLVGWLEDERGRIRERLRLTEAAEQWLKHDRDAGALLRGTLLEDARRHPDLSELEQSFLQASIEAKETAERERELAHQRELEQARQLAAEQQQRAEAEKVWAEYQANSAAKLRQRAWLLGLSTVAALSLASLAFWLGNVATAERNAAEEQSATAVAAENTAVTASTETYQQALLARTAEAVALAAQETAVQDANTARIAVAIAVAEQTKVAHARGALADTVQELTILLTAVAPSSIVVTAEPEAIATPVPVTPTRLVNTEAPALAQTVELTAAIEAYASIRQSPTLVAAVIQENMPNTAGVTVTTINTNTVIVTEPLVPDSTLIVTDTAESSNPSSPSVEDTDQAVTTTVSGGSVGDDIANAPEATPDRLPLLPDISALVPAIDIDLHAQPNADAEILMTIHGPMQLSLLEARSEWVKVLVEDVDTRVDNEVLGQIGWLQAWDLNYLGNPAALPTELRYLVIKAAELPFIDGQVVGPVDSLGYPLIEALTAEVTELITVPIGSAVTLISYRNLTPAGATDIEPIVWFYVSVADPAGENRIWRGYLPSVVIAPEQ